MKNVLTTLFHHNEHHEKLPLTRYVLYVLLVTLTVTGVAFSRYTTTSSLDAVARMANFNVSVTHATWSHGVYADIASHVLNGNKAYVFTVTNNSEVVVRARLVIDSYDGTAPTVSPSSWFTLAVGASQNVTMTVVGAVDGNDVDLHVEYEQVD